MEEILVNKVLGVILKNETPTGVIIAGVLLYLLYRVKYIKKDIELIRDDLKFIKLTLINKGVQDGDNTNVIKLDNNKKLDR